MADEEVNKDTVAEDIEFMQQCLLTAHKSLKLLYDKLQEIKKDILGEDNG